MERARFTEETLGVFVAAIPHLPVFIFAVSLPVHRPSIYMDENNYNSALHD
jgi:hypothetical protein